MVTKVLASSVVGLSAIPIEVEVDVASRGLPSFTIVGLPDKGVQEAKERVKAALVNSGATLPPKKIVVNLAPSNVPKTGSGFDLSIAVGILLGTESISVDDLNAVFIGELSLGGEIKPATGVLPAVIMAKEKMINTIFIPYGNRIEASIVEGIEIFAPKNLTELTLHLTNTKKMTPLKQIKLSSRLKKATSSIDIAEIVGQNQAKRALEVAAAGDHNIFFTGMPGAGKTMLARALAGILPKLTLDESLELTKIYSITGKLTNKTQLITKRPFRSPHHTISKTGMCGGGTYPMPGEVTLAHRGVLFLDELPEFPRSVIESLRQPLEDGSIQITRANQTVNFPSKCMFVAAANPCPCGYYGHPIKPCKCTNSQIQNYQKKVSGPMLDRIDIHIHISAVNIKKLAQRKVGSETSHIIQKRIESASNTQRERFGSDNKNAHMSNKQIKKFCQLSTQAEKFLTLAAQKLHLSARSYFKTIKVARTIADLAHDSEIKTIHIKESLQYRYQNNPT